jgi:hypothetical protein
MMNLAVLTTTFGMRYSIDMTPLKDLRLFHLELEGLRPSHRNRWVSRILSRISSAHLEDVVILLHSSARSIGVDLSNVLEWSEVDAILQRSTFSRLKNVEVRRDLRLWDTVQSPDPQRSFSAEIVELLP